MDISITIIKCSNSEVIKACAFAASGLKNLMGNIEWQDDGTKLIIETDAAGTDLNNSFSDAIKGISRRFPNDVITCRHTHEVRGGANPYASDVHIVEYHNGERKEVDIEPGYLIDLIRLKNEKDSWGIYDKAEAFFRRLDKTETDKDGKLFIDWFPEKVCYEFEYDGADGIKYKAVATKCLKLIFNTSRGIPLQEPA